MWLLPLLNPAARAAAFVYYRIAYAGGRIPERGAALLVANHPNSLLDPMLVAAVAGRPVRFLAKAPLFADTKVGWLVRAAGSIPVYRRQDDPGQVQRNEEMFRAAHAALAAGAAVAIFPEGISHSLPAMAPLRTGAARIALGAAAQTGTAIPVIPVGLVFRRKAQFRSDALVMIGEPVSWHDLVDAGPEDADAVRVLTQRIAVALGNITTNLDAWQDAPLVDTALQIWEAESRATPGAAARVARHAITTTVLAQVRVSGDAEGLALIDAVRAHRRRLARLGLRPHDLTADIGTARALRWATGRLPLALPVAAVIATAGWLVFLVPYRVTRMLTDRISLAEDTRATWKLMVGALVYLVWLLLLAVAAGVVLGWVAVLLVLVVVPGVGMGGLLVRERWRGAWRDARRWLLLRSRKPLLDTLRETQCELGSRLDRLQQRMATPVE